MITFKEYLIEKPLTPQQRIARSRVMKRLAPKLALKRKLAAKKKASPEKIKARARKQAIDMVRAKFSKNKYNSLSFSAKAQIDRKVEAKKGLVDKLTKKLIPKVKRAEAERLQKSKEEATTSQN
jgi:hypothetical protein